MVGARTCSFSGYIGAKDGTTIMEKEKILKNGRNASKNCLKTTGKGSHQSLNQRMDIEIKIESSYVQNEKRNKAAGPDGITVEQLASLESIR